MNINEKPDSGPNYTSKTGLIKLTLPYKIQCVRECYYVIENVKPTYTYYTGYYVYQSKHSKMLPVQCSS